MRLGNDGGKKGPGEGGGQEFRRGRKSDEEINSRLETLLPGINAGSESAFSEAVQLLASAHWLAAWAAARKSGLQNDHDLCKTGVITGWTNAWKQLGKIQFEHADGFRAFTYVVVGNATLSEIRSRGRGAKFVLPLDDREDKSTQEQIRRAATPHAEEERRAAIAEILYLGSCGLDDIDRPTFAAYSQDRSAPFIARELGILPREVPTRVKRMIRHLRPLLEALGAGEYLDRGDGSASDSGETSGADPDEDP